MLRQKQTNKKNNLETYDLSSYPLKIKASWVLVAHACNPSHSGGREQEDQSSKPAGK
jgi:hypothetical protein